MAFTKNRNIPLNLFIILERLIELNSAIDPFIYAYRTRNIREALEKFFKYFKHSKSVSDESNSNTNNIRKVSVFTVSSLDLIM